MTPEQRAAALGDLVETDGDDCRVLIWSSEIAAAIRAAVLAEREACARLADATNQWIGAEIRARPAP